MKLNLLKSLIIFAILAGLTSSLFGEKAEKEDDWEEVTTKSDIKIFSKRVPGSPVVTVKGEGVLNFPMDKIVEVLLDIPGTLEWVDHAVEAKILQQISEHEFITYCKFTPGVPFVSKRDFVNLNKVVFTPETKTVFFSTHSVTEPHVPTVNTVRGKVTDSSITLREIDKDKTEIVTILNSDPMGSVPKWIVNQLLKRVPLKTFEGLKKQLAKKRDAAAALKKADTKTETKPKS